MWGSTVSNISVLFSDVYARKLKTIMGAHGMGGLYGADILY